MSRPVQILLLYSVAGGQGIEWGLGVRFVFLIDSGLSDYVNKSSSALSLMMDLSPLTVYTVCDYIAQDVSRGGSPRHPVFHYPQSTRNS